MAMLAPQMRPFPSYTPPMYPMGPTMPYMGPASEVVRSSSLTAPAPLTSTWKGMPAMMQNPLMQTQQMVQQVAYMNGQPANLSFVPPAAPPQMPLMATFQQMPQMVPYQPGMNLSFVPPVAQAMPGQMPQMPGMPQMAGPEASFKQGDRVQLRGHAANPHYEGKLYTVEAVDASGNVMVAHRISERNVSRMTFQRQHLELVTPAEECPPEVVEPEVVQAPPPVVAESFQVGDTVRVVGLGPRHNGRTCSVESVDMMRRILRVKFLDSNDMLELGPTYLELLERARERPSQVAPERFGAQGEGGLRVGDSVMILAPPQHRGKVAVVDVPNTGDGSLRVRLQDPQGQVNMLLLSPTHVQNLDGTPVAGTAEAMAASQAQVNAMRQAAAMPPPPLAVQPGDRVRVKPTLQSHGGKAGIVELPDDGTGCAIVQIQDVMGIERIRINPVHLDFA